MTPGPVVVASPMPNPMPTQMPYAAMAVPIIPEGVAEMPTIDWFWTPSLDEDADEESKLDDDTPRRSDVAVNNVCRKHRPFTGANRIEIRSLNLKTKP